MDRSSLQPWKYLARTKTCGGTCVQVAPTEWTVWVSYLHITTITLTPLLVVHLCLTLLRLQNPRRNILRIAKIKEPTTVPTLFTTSPILQRWLPLEFNLWGESYVKRKRILTAVLICSFRIPFLSQIRCICNKQLYPLLLFRVLPPL